MSSVIRRLNDRRDAAVELGEDAGFTLIELMVVLLILAILLAIAIPTFLGVTGGANDRAAQSNLNTALTTAKAAETSNGQAYNTTGGGTGNVTAASLQSNEPSISFVAGAVTGSGPVSVYVDPNGNGIILASYSKPTNTCWYAVDNVQAVAPTASTLYATANSSGSATSAPTKQGDYYGEVKEVSGTTTTCDATAAAFQTTAGISIGWGSSFSAAAAAG